MPMAFLVCNQKYLFICLKGFKLKLKIPQIEEKNVLKWSFVAVLSKFNKWTSRTKLCAPPWGIYCRRNFLKKISQTDYGEKKFAVKLKKTQFDRWFSALGESHHIWIPRPATYIVQTLIWLRKNGVLKSFLRYLIAWTV